MAEIGKRIKERREELGLTQEELATRLGYKSKSTINKIEMGINDINQSKIEAFANALHTTPAHLMGWIISENEKPEIEIVQVPEDKERAAKLWAKYMLAPDYIQKTIDDLLKGQ